MRLEVADLEDCLGVGEVVFGQVGIQAGLEARRGVRQWACGERCLAHGVTGAKWGLTADRQVDSTTHLRRSKVGNPR